MVWNFRKTGCSILVSIFPYNEISTNKILKMKKLIPIIPFALLLIITGCRKDDDFLDIPPTQIIPEDLAFSDPALVLSILGDLYNRQLDFSALDGTPTDPGWRSFADFSESFPSENGSYYIVQRTGWDYGTWGVN